VAYNACPNRATNIVVAINTAEGIKTAVLNQRQQPNAAPFTSLGTFRFREGQDGWVEIRSAGADGYVIADAVQWIFREKP